MFFFSCLLALSSALVVLEGQKYRKEAISKVLSGPSAPKVDLEKMTRKDLKHVPLSFIEKATPEQWEKIKTFENVNKAPKNILKAISERREREESPVLEAEADEPNKRQNRKTSAMPFDLLPFTEVKQDLAPPGFCNACGPDLIVDQEISLDSLFIQCGNTYMEKNRNCYNDLRRRSYNFLKGAYDTSGLDYQDLRALWDWAFISIVLSAGLKRHTNSMKLIAWFKRLPMFSSKCTVPLKSWATLLRECKQVNSVLWKAMQKYSFARVRKDPAYANFDPYAGLGGASDSEEDDDEVIVATVAPMEITPSTQLGSGNWIASLEAEMKWILQHKAPEKAELEALVRVKSARRRSIPFLLLDPLPIAEIFRTRAFNVNGRTIRGPAYRNNIKRQYALLRGRTMFESNEEETLLITEWAMITMIFNCSSLPPQHSLYVRWLRDLPMDFAKLLKRKDPPQNVSFAQSVAYLQAAKDLSPALWDAMAIVAAGRFLADPERDDLPLLDRWINTKIALIENELGDLTRLMQSLKAVEVKDLGYSTRRLEEILQDVETKQDVSMFLEALQEALSSLYLYPDQISHGSIMAKEIDIFLRSK